jgi:hypothetical protein
MRFSASLLVMILAGLVVVVGLFVGRSADPTSSVAAEGDAVVAATPATDVAPVAEVTMGGSGSSATTATESAQAVEQEWVRVPGTGVAIWPKPQVKAD